VCKVYNRLNEGGEGGGFEWNKNGALAPTVFFTYLRWCFPQWLYGLWLLVRRPTTD